MSVSDIRGGPRRALLLVPILVGLGAEVCRSTAEAFRFIWISRLRRLRLRLDDGDGDGRFNLLFFIDGLNRLRHRVGRGPSR